MYTFIFIYIDMCVCVCVCAHAHWLHHNKIIMEAHSTPISFSLRMSPFKKTQIVSTYRNIFVDKIKILHPNNNIKILKILEVLYIKFRQTTFNRINLETCDNISKRLK